MRIDTGNRIVDRVYDLTQPDTKGARCLFEGHVIPRGWYRCLRTEYGEPDFVAIALLSEVVYWYRPSDKDKDGNTVPWHKKFDAYKLHVNYEDYAKRFMMTKRQVQAAFHRLWKQQIITIEIKHSIISKKGVLCNNVVYVEPVLDAVLQISDNEIYARGNVDDLQN